MNLIREIYNPTNFDQNFIQIGGLLCELPQTWMNEKPEVTTAALRGLNMIVGPNLDPTRVYGVTVRYRGRSTKTWILKEREILTVFIYDY